MTSAGNEANLRAMIEPIRQYFDGLVFTFHHPIDDGAYYLQSVQGAGRVIYAIYCQRHGYSLTHCLWQGPMENGDHFVLLDTLERVSAPFVRDILPGIIHEMRAKNIAMVANYGKGLVFRFNEQLEFRGSPHWYTTGLDGGTSNLELPKEHFWNVRSEQRDPYHWVGHYAKYMLFPAGSNHALLGLDHHPGRPEEVFPQREAKRLAFRTELLRRGYDTSLSGLKAMLSHPIDDVTRALINSDKVWNDYYRYEILGDKAVFDSHNPAHMQPI